MVKLFSFVSSEHSLCPVVTGSLLLLLGTCKNTLALSFDKLRAGTGRSPPAVSSPGWIVLFPQLPFAGHVLLLPHGSASSLPYPLNFITVFLVLEAISECDLMSAKKRGLTLKISNNLLIVDFRWILAYLSLIRRPCSVPWYLLSLCHCDSEYRSVTFILNLPFMFIT